jgi:hypothetical protein
VSSVGTSISLLLATAALASCIDDGQRGACTLIGWATSSMPNGPRCPPRCVFADLQPAM